MDFKKNMPMMFLFIILAFMVVQPVSAATTRVAICDDNFKEVTSFHSTQNDEV